MSKSDLSSNLKVALVYDRVNTPHGGAEKLLRALHQIWPQAPLYTSVYNPLKAQWAQIFPQVIPSFLNSIPFARNHHRLLAPLMPLAFESFDFKGFDLVISITSAEAKGIITHPDTLHVCYLLTPPRYLYSYKKKYQQEKIIFKLPLIKNLANYFLTTLTRWDQIAINRPDVVIPISQLVKKRVEMYYQFKCEEPIYPTILNSQELAVNKKLSKSLPQNYFLIVSRLVSYKKIDLAIKACQQLGENLIIVGEGPERKKLQKIITSPQIKLLGSVDLKQLHNLYQNCLAVLMPGEEDFGITALESLSFGKPVIINKNSGAAELIQNRKTGLLLKKTDLQAITDLLLEVRKITWDPAIMKRCVLEKDTSFFKKQFASTIKRHLKKDQ